MGRPGTNGATAEGSAVNADVSASGRRPSSSRSCSSSLKKENGGSGNVSAEGSLTISDREEVRPLRKSCFVPSLTLMIVVVVLAILHNNHYIC